MAAKISDQEKVQYLVRFVRSSNYGKALDTVKDLLKSSPSDNKLLCTKIGCLLHLENFDEVLKAISSLPAPISQQLIFERAYAEYRLNKIQEGLQTVRSVASSPSSSNRIKDLHAQLLYKSEQFEECLSLYKDSTYSTKDDYSNERLANLSAAVAALSLWHRKDHGKAIAASDSLTYDTLFNEASFLLGQLRTTEAEAKFRAAQELCRRSLADEEHAAAGAGSDSEGEDDRVEQELAPIRTQLALALQLQGRTDEARALYQQVVKLKPSDASLASVAMNNAASVIARYGPAEGASMEGSGREAGKSPFDMRLGKKFKAIQLGGTPTASLNSGALTKLATAQRAVLVYNQAVSAFLNEQSAEFKKLTASLRELGQSAKFGSPLTPSTPELLSRLELASLVRERKTDEAIRFLQQQIASSARPDAPASSFKRNLALAQLLLESGRSGEAIDLLLALPPQLQYSLAVFSVLLSLLGPLPDQTKLKQLLDSAVRFWKSVQPDQAQLARIMGFSVKYFVLMKQPQNAAALLEESRRNDPSDMAITSQLISLYAEFNLPAAEKLIGSLPALPSLSDLLKGAGAGGVADVEALENAFLYGAKLKTRAEKPAAPGSKAAGPAVDAASRTEAERETKRVASRRSKAKERRRLRVRRLLSRRIDPNVKPDPERWLPKHERTTFKGRKNKRRKERDALKGTQGAAADNETGSSAAAATSPAAATVDKSGAAGPRLQKPVGAAQKQKRKKKALH